MSLVGTASLWASAPGVGPLTTQLRGPANLAVFSRSVQLRGETDSWTAIAAAQFSMTWNFGKSTPVVAISKKGTKRKIEKGKKKGNKCSDLLRSLFRQNVDNYFPPGDTIQPKGLSTCTWKVAIQSYCITSRRTPSQIHFCCGFKKSSRLIQIRKVKRQTSLVLSENGLI